MVRAEERKRELVDGVAGLCQQRIGDGRAAAVARFVRHFYAHVPPDDVVQRSADDLYGAALSLWEFAQQRPAGTAKVRVFNPQPGEHGWASPRTIVEIVNDDMPFLVDSVTAALNALDLDVHLVIHPIFHIGATRRAGSTLLGADEGAPGALRESLMHVEVTEQSRLRRAGADRGDALPRAGRRARRGRRLAAMRTALARGARRAGEPAAAAAAARDRRGDRVPRWLDDDNFTFLGYREYRFEPTGDRRLALGSTRRGLGILRDPISVFDGLRSSSTLPPEVQRVPPPAHPPDHHQVRTGAAPSTAARTWTRSASRPSTPTARSSASASSSGSSPRSPTAAAPRRSRCSGGRSKRCSSAPASPRTATTARRCSHILDTYPRDELFQIGEDELFDIAIGS